MIFISNGKTSFEESIAVIISKMKTEPDGIPP
jgi:hypothetical protein